VGAVMILAGIWALSLLLASPLFVYKELINTDTPTLLQQIGLQDTIPYCIEDWPTRNGRFYYSIFSLCVQYLVPILIVSVAYFGIYNKLKSRITVVAVQAASAQRKLTLEMLAKFHAASIILQQRHPELLTKCFFTHFFSRDKKAYSEVFTGLFRAFLRFINGQPNLKQTYGDKLEKLRTHIMEYGARVYDVGEGDLRTLNHGDCWTTNIMFQYDDAGDPQTVVAIDFQFSNCTSPTIDLHYFFTTSLKEEVRDKEPELVEHHYNALKANLEKFSYKGLFPTLEEYQLQFERRRFMSKLS